MSMLTFILNASIINSHALLNATAKKGNITIHAMVMKRRIILQLFAEYIYFKTKRHGFTAILSLRIFIPPENYRQVRKTFNMHTPVEIE